MSDCHKVLYIFCSSLKQAVKIMEESLPCILNCEGSDNNTSYCLISLFSLYMNNIHAKF